MNKLIKRDPTKWIIAFGFSCLLALTSSITFVSLTQMDENIESMAELVDVTNAKVEAVQTMREAARLRGETLINMFLLRDEIAREEMRLQLSTYALKYINARDLFSSYDLNARELQLFSQIKPLAIHSETLANEAADLMLSGSPNSMIRTTLAESNLARRSVLNVFDELIEYQNRYAKTVLEDSVGYHESTREIIILLATASFLFGILISIVVIRQTGRKNYEIQHQATHDALTQLANRKEFEHRLSNAIESAQDVGREHGLCFMDLDQFKIINDTCGHDAGDALLIKLSQLIKNSIREHDTLGRLGGDEFGLLLEDCSLEKALEIADCLVNTVRNYAFNWKGRDFHVGVSIGLVHITSKCKDVTSVMSEADIACYAAKDMGRNRVHVHELNDEHVKKIHKELSWVADIGDSLKHNRFKLYVQPIAPISAHASTTKNIFEVLLRLKDDEQNIISPGEYIPAAERFNLMRAVDNWVISQTMQKISEIHDSGQTDVPLMFVNLSANSLVDQTFCYHIIELLQEYKIPERSICFEITETAAIKNIEQAKKVMNMLRETHCLFALDDFGSGMSSFTYLKNLPVDFLKIDGSIVNKIDLYKADQAMVSAINQIGRVMDIRTIAEHVESEVILDRLQSIGVDYAQGYHIGRPVPIDTIQTQLETATAPA